MHVGIDNVIFGVQLQEIINENNFLSFFKYFSYIKFLYHTSKLYTIIYKIKIFDPCNPHVENQDLKYVK